MSAPDAVLGPDSRVDALASIPGSTQVLAGCSSMQGPRWLGAVAVVTPSHEPTATACAVAASTGTVAGIPALAVFPTRDPFTGGQHRLASWLA